MAKSLKKEIIKELIPKKKGKALPAKVVLSNPSLAKVHKESESVKAREYNSRKRT